MMTALCGNHEDERSERERRTAQEIASDGEKVRLRWDSEAPVAP